MTVRLSLAYQCDVAGCDTPPHVDARDLPFHGAGARPCAPNGWLYLDQVGIMCARHGAKFEEQTQKFFTEPGHE